MREPRPCRRGGGAAKIPFPYFEMPSVFTLLLSHQRPEALASVLKRWIELVGAESLFMAYGGSAADFDRIAFENKAFIADDLLRVPDQQRQYQSWRAVLRAGLTQLGHRSEAEFVYLTEYDHLPLVQDLHRRMHERLLAEKADVVGHHLHRIDGTNFPHYLFHASEARFHAHFESISRRSDKRVILSMLPTGSFWKREAFEAVASKEEPVPVYVELYLPTLAHHLGFRVREFTEQNPFVLASGDRLDEIPAARAAGAWTLHPVKSALPTESPIQVR